MVFGSPYACTKRNLEDAGTAGNGSRNMKSWFVTYKRPMAPPGMISQVITSTHGCILTVTGPIIGVELPDKTEIGRYRRPCDAQEIELLKGLAASAISEDSAAQHEAVPRGTRFLTFGIGETGKDIERFASVPMSKQFAPSVKQFDDAMIASARKSLEHPHTTLTGIASLPSSPVIPQQEFRLEFALRNSGTAPVSICNPAAVQDDEKVGVEVMIEKNVPQENMEEEDRVYVRLKEGEVAQLRAPGENSGGRPEPITRLNPGHEIAFLVQIKRHVYIGAGSYRAWVTYESRTEGIPEEEAVTGLLRIPAGTFTVNRRK
ncbi:MAG: hypothetical protein HY203_09085 [Nitrospirae bacterium]|nr:hypothetical protein [Nitrospirota bacterium]